MSNVEVKKKEDECEGVFNLKNWLPHAAGREWQMPISTSHCKIFNDKPTGWIVPIAIEPYGAVTNLGKAYRTSAAKQDFYTFFDVWARGEK